MEILTLLGTIGGLIALALVAGVISIALFCVAVGYVGCRIGRRVIQIEAFDGRIPRHE
jgi:hypothetical protein